MAIKLPNLEEIKTSLLSKKDHVFKDLHLDFKKDGNFSPLLQRYVETNDIKVSYDLNAIRNSIYNLFGTRPGQRFLFPKYGLDLFPYVFEAVTQQNGEIVGKSIVRAIEQFEQRVYVEQCRVESKPEDHRYDVTLFLSVPIFDTRTTLSTQLNAKTQTFTHL